MHAADTGDVKDETEEDGDKQKGDDVKNMIDEEFNVRVGMLLDRIRCAGSRGNRMTVSEDPSQAVAVHMQIRRGVVADDKESDQQDGGDTVLSKVCFHVSFKFVGTFQAIEQLIETESQLYSNIKFCFQVVKENLNDEKCSSGAATKNSGSRDGRFFCPPGRIVSSRV